MVQPKEDDSIEFNWGKKRGFGGIKKDVQFYESFTYDNMEYKLFDSVYMYDEKEPEPHIGKIIKIWENANETKRVKILWFFRPCEIENYIEADKTPDNELFLASGEGVGLANVNPLEAIAGKCNVVCISRDSRNPQPSDEEIQMADFIFYRTFDVKSCLVSDKIDDKIAGVDVKCLLNRVTQKSSIPMPDSSKKELSGNAVVTDGAVVLSENNTSGKQKTLETDDSSTDASAKEKEDSKVFLANRRSSLGQKPDSSAGLDLVEMVKVDTQGSLFGDKTTSKVKENTESVRLSVKQKSSFVETPPNICDQLGEVKINGPQKNTAMDKTHSKSNDKEIKDGKPSLVKQKSLLGVTNAPNLAVELDEMAKNTRLECLPNEKSTLRSKDDPVKDESKPGKIPATEVQVEGKVHAAKDSGRVDDRPCKKAKPDDVVKASGENNKKIVQKSNHDFGGSYAKTVNRNTSASENKSKRKIVKDSHGNEKISSKKPKLVKDSHVNENISSKKPKLVNDPRGNEKLNKLANGKLPKASAREASSDVNKTNNQVSKVAQRPEVDKSKWFKEPVVPWEERLQTAHAEGKLVLLQNLDPSYTAAEVEDIVRHAFKLNCTAKMIQQTAFSSPHSGQAFVIFKTREATEMVVTKLNEGCLLLSNARPLVGSVATFSFPGKLSTFFGHISIDKLRLHMQREMKEAVSTSHCSQPNTIEYDMAMDWCLLQEKTDLEWKLLYKQQGKELRELKSTLKFK